MSKGRVVALPPIFPIIQPLFESTHYDLINSLGLSIPLWVSRGGIPIHNSQVITIPPKGFAIKLKSIVRDEGMKDPKTSVDVLLEKSVGIHIPDVC